ncbi:MAG TPA: DUF3047 domain-containing protein [Candidatus Deferrimicrobiaceae bacterium]
MRSARGKGASLFFALAVFILAAAATAAGDGWTELSPEWGDIRPERKAVYSDNGITVEFVNPPGSAIGYERSGKWPASSTASIRMYADNVNVTGNGYVPSEAYFPISITFAFGEDSLDLGWRERVSLFFRQMWSGFHPSGICLTYAWGNRVPQGSMYRLWQEETVFVLAGGDEAGKEIAGSRRLADDFRAAYARPPKGPVTKILVRARRPSGEKGTLKGNVSLAFPAN